jgi:hypothetical protein
MALAQNEINAIVMQYPSGKFGYVGWRVPGELSFLATPEELQKARDAGITHFLKKRVFETQDEANGVLSAWLEAHPEYTNVGGIA